MLLGLAACATPHPFAGLTHTGTAQVAGFSFTVNWNDERAEATRTNTYWSRDMTPVRAAAIVAVRQVTGCTVREGSVDGDIALVTMRLRCEGASATPRVQCSGIALDTYGDGGVLDVDIRCEEI